MEQVKKGMKKKLEQIVVRKYLLGDLSDEAKIRQIEEKILLDDNFTEELSIAEDELIDEYLEGRLQNDESERFVGFFLNSAERKQKLRLIKNLRKYATLETDAQIAAQPARREFRFFDWRGLFSPATLGFAVILLAICGAGFGIWRVAFYQSDSDKGLAQLRVAYQGKRPFESRTTANFDYAPVSDTRGNAPAGFDEKARSRAQMFLLDASENPTDAKAHHALGLFYLTDKKFDSALNEFNIALKLTPDNAGLHNDIGAALLEKAGQTEKEGKLDESLEHLALALKSVNRALEINDSLPETLFNQALILQKMRLMNQAQAAWEKYLEKDSTSPWAEEARRNLELLKRQNGTMKDKSEILQDFLESYRKKDDSRAWEIVSQTKELITGVMIQPQLTRKFLEADEQSRKEETAEILSALIYLGELEKQNAKDSFFERLAEYYSKTNRRQRQKLFQAHAAMQQGYELLLKADWKASLDSFQKAKTMFSETNDGWEAGIAEFQICYCLCQLKQIKESNERLQALSNWGEQKNYKWLQSLADGWLGNNYSILGEHSKAINYAQKSFKTAQEISDTLNSQKVSNHLTHEYLLIGNSPQALTNIYQNLSFSNFYFSSPRQKSRNLLIATRGLYFFKYYDAAAAFGFEQIYAAQAEPRKDAWLSHTAHNQLALIYGKAGKYEEAFREIEAGFQLADSFPDETMRQVQNTETRLMLAHLHREADNFREAINNYSRVIQDYENTDFSIYKYEARKGKLVCLAALKDESAIKEEMPALLKMFDENRQTIAEESNRNVFFDNEQTVYDIAVDYAYTRQKDSEQAFNYAENSRARSLLDLIKNEKSPPLTLTEIRRQMPDDVNIVYYAVLDNKLLIWQISNTRFTTAEKPINADDFNDLIEKYKKLLIGKNDSRDTAKKLYALLIAPIESTLEPNKPVCIVADKILFQIPFAALVSPRTNKYLIEDFSLLYAPSATVFITETEIAGKKSTAQDETILSVGNPTFSGNKYSELANLPAAEREAEAIAALYNSAKVFVGSKAVKVHIADNLDEADVWHFATHYIPNENSPLLSKFLLASDDLTIAEIMRKKLPRTRLIILSACETGIEGFYKGEGMVGAARAFLASDVPLIVASQWAIDSEATAELMIKFHYYRKQKGMTTINSLRRAQVDMLTGSDTRFNQPFYWAGFLPIGGYAVY